MSPFRFSLTTAYPTPPFTITYPDVAFPVLSQYRLPGRPPPYHHHFRMSPFPVPLTTAYPAPVPRIPSAELSLLPHPPTRTDPSQLPGHRSTIAYPALVSNPRLTRPSQHHHYLPGVPGAPRRAQQFLPSEPTKLFPPGRHSTTSYPAHYPRSLPYPRRGPLWHPRPRASFGPGLPLTHSPARVPPDPKTVGPKTVSSPSRGRPSPPPPPGVERPDGGRVLPQQISPARAYAQHLVTTRLLECSHDPAGRLSRLQRIRPCSPRNCNPPAGTPARFRGRPVAGPLRYLARRPIRIRLRACRVESSPLSGMDSDLEAFSHNPADGSVAALPGRTAAKTNYLNPRFLSY